MLSLINAIVLRPLPISHPEQLHIAQVTRPDEVHLRFSYPAFESAQALPGQERAQLAASQSIVPAQTPSASPIRYQLETPVPENWIPFLPVAIDAQLRDIALERAAVIREAADGTLVPVLPRGRVLTPPGLNPYQVREEEVTRAGTRVLRCVCRSRWVDGSTHVWIARRRPVGTGEGSSGLKYDLGTTA